MSGVTTALSAPTDKLQAQQLPEQWSQLNANVQITADNGVKEKMQELAMKPAKQLRKDGDPETAFKNAAQVIERTYNAPFLAHNCMEPMSFLDHVTDEKHCW